ANSSSIQAPRKLRQLRPATWRTAVPATWLCVRNSLTRSDRSTPSLPAAASGAFGATRPLLPGLSRSSSCSSSRSLERGDGPVATELVHGWPRAPISPDGTGTAHSMVGLAKPAVGAYCVPPAGTPAFALDQGTRLSCGTAPDVWYMGAGGLPPAGMPPLKLRRSSDWLSNWLVAGGGASPSSTGAGVASGATR